MASIFRQQFHMCFLERKLFKFDSNFTETCSQRCYWQSSCIDSDIGLLSNQQQDITWTNSGLVYLFIFVTWSDELNKLCHREVRVSATHWFLCFSLVCLLMVMAFYVVMPTLCCQRGEWMIYYFIISDPDILEMGQYQGYPTIFLNWIQMSNLK